jgi:hypothetical protein
VTDARNQQEREQRRRWRESNYPGECDDLVAGNNIADQLAKRGTEGHAYELPTFPTFVRTIYLGYNTRRISDIRKYLHEKMQIWLTGHIAKLKCFKWMRIECSAQVDVPASNYILDNRDR